MPADMEVEIDGDVVVAEMMFPPTKFAHPHPVDSVAPPVVAGTLVRAIEDHAFTLLVAPAGSGKTTALSWWAQEVRAWRSSWLRIDRQDDDSQTLAAAMLAAVRAVVPSSGPRLAQVLGDGAQIDPRRLAGAFVSDLAAIGRLAIVLDDLHLVTGRPALDFLEGVLDHLPADCRVVAAARHRPQLRLARRGVRGELAVLGADDLRLDLPAVEAMLAGSGLKDGMLARDVLAHTHGWAAAVRAAVLAAGARRAHAPRHDRALTNIGDDLDAFLREEVFDELPQRLREFLLDTCFLRDLTPAACQEVSGRHDASELLAEVARRGLFVTSVSAAPPALRFHELFSEFLQRRVTAERPPAVLAELRRRAADVSPPGDAIALLVAAGEIDAAAQIASRAGRAQLARSGAPLPVAWLSHFDEAARERHPWLGLLTGLADNAAGRMAEGREALAPALEGLKRNGDQIGARHAALALAESCLGLGDVDRAGQLLTGLLAEQLPPDDRIKALVTRVWFDFFAMNWDGVDAGLAEAFDLSLGSASGVGRRTLALGLSTELLFSGHGPAWLEANAGAVADRLDSDLSLPAAAVRVVVAGAALLRGDLKAVAREIEVAAALAREFGGLGWLDLALDRVRLGLALATGDHPTVDVVTATAEKQIASSSVHHQERAMYAYALARSLWIRDRRSEVAEVRHRFLRAVSSADRPDTLVADGVIAALVARHEGRAEDAERRLQVVLEVHRDVRFCVLTGVPDIELAELHLAGGDESRALRHAREGLRTLTERQALGVLLLDGPDAHLDLFVRCVHSGIHAAVIQQLLDAVRSRPARGVLVHDSGETLTAREVEVLRCVVRGDSNRAIASALFIGERTVKSHMTSLMRKLGVASRTQAAARARELGLG